MKNNGLELVKKNTFISMLNLKIYPVLWGFPKMG